MKFEEYCAYFERVISKESDVTHAPYDNPDYLNYTKLNWSRMNRWLKSGILPAEAEAMIQQVNVPQQWIVITEPWCGDAAHSIPFIQMIGSKNPLITISYELRDSEPFQINSYLTLGVKSIPKLIIRNADGVDLATWGPRPGICQRLYANLIQQGTSSAAVKLQIQNWYNKDKGKTISHELGLIVETSLREHADSPAYL